MDTRSLAQPAPTTTRLERGAELYRDHFDRFAYVGDGVYLVPSGSDATSVYEVSLRGGERCECADHEHRGGRCKHILALRIFKARTGTCEGCGERHRRRDMYEVGDDHPTFFEGDDLCGPCASRAGVR
ncbi:MAG: hypothetical protein M3N18_10920 [Actinomycetota bacterium]|nr:hypothetical protein [Actinomycetota bacterium]